MAKYTSAEANKLLRKTMEELKSVKMMEQKASTFHAAATEDVEAVRPAYDYAGTQEKINALSAKIRAIKHAINAFNVRTEVPGFDMTIDQMLVYIPQLSEKKQKLLEMAGRLPRERITSSYRSAGFIDYILINYPAEQVKEDLRKVTDELAAAQNALDKVNMTGTMEIDV